MLHSQVFWGLELSIWEFEGLLNFTSELGSEGSGLEGCWGSLAVPEFWDIQVGQMSPSPHQGYITSGISPGKSGF